jgi:hypothetical protein
VHVVDFAHGAAVREWRGHKREVNRLALLQVILREPQRPAHTNLEKQATTRNVASPCASPVRTTGAHGAPEMTFRVVAGFSRFGLLLPAAKIKTRTRATPQMVQVACK